MSAEEIREVLKKVIHPEIDASLVELGMIKDVTVKGNKATVGMAFPFPGVPIKHMLVDSVREPLEKLGFQVEIKQSIMNQEELQKFLKMERDSWKGL